MGKIRIIATPPGLAPVRIREMWVGVEIKLPTKAELEADPPGEMFIGSDNEGGHLVRMSDCLDGLKKAKKHRAYNFWENLGLSPTEYLRFKKEVCEVVE